MIEESAEPGLLAGIALVPEAPECCRLVPTSAIVRQVIEASTPRSCHRIAVAGRRKEARRLSPPNCSTMLRALSALGGEVPSSASTAMAARGLVEDSEPPSVSLRLPGTVTQHLSRPARGATGSEDHHPVRDHRDARRESVKSLGHRIEVAAPDADHHSHVRFHGPRGRQDDRDDGGQEPRRVSTHPTTVDAFGCVQLSRRLRAPNRGVPAARVALYMGTSSWIPTRPRPAETMETPNRPSQLGAGCEP